jgi:hypothetical protein
MYAARLEEAQTGMDGWMDGRKDGTDETKSRAWDGDNKGRREREREQPVKARKEQ